MKTKTPKGLEGKRPHYRARIVTPLWACRPGDRAEVALNQMGYACSDAAVAVECFIAAYKDVVA